MSNWTGLSEEQRINGRPHPTTHGLAGLHKAQDSYSINIHVHNRVLQVHDGRR